MKSSKPPVKYRGTALPVPLIEEIKATIKDNPNYRSMAEFIRDACREKIEREEKIKRKIDENFIEQGSGTTKDMDVIKMIVAVGVSSLVEDSENIVEKELKELLSSNVSWEDFIKAIGPKFRYAFKKIFAECILDLFNPDQNGKVNFAESFIKGPSLKKHTTR